jgi:hypothetical protein
MKEEFTYIPIYTATGWEWSEKMQLNTACDEECEYDT